MLTSFYSEFMINVSFELLSASLLTELKSWLIIPFSVLCVLLPVVGWVGDSLLGRYRAMIAGFFLLTVAFLTFLSAFVMLHFNWTQIPAIIMLMCVTDNDSFRCWEYLHKHATIYDRSNDWSLS